MGNIKDKRTLRIAHFGQKNCMTTEGGVEVVVSEIAKRQVLMGHKVTCYNRNAHHVSGSEFDVPKEKEWNGIRMKYVPTIEKKGLSAVSSSFFATLCCAFGRYDVVHIHAEGPAVFCWLPKLFGKIVICHNHGLDWNRAKWKGGFASKYIKLGEKMSVKYAKKLIVLSEDIKEYFQNTYQRQAIYVPNGVNRPQIEESNLISEKFGLSKNEFILYLSRVVSEKRVDLLINAFKEVSTDKKLVIAGGASDSEDFYNEMKEKASDDERIIFTGFVQGKLKDELYSNAYIYVLPSDLEGMPLCLLEAMSYGNCCLASDIKECANVIKDKGVQFVKGNENDLAEKLQKLCDNPEMVKEYGEVAAEYICDRFNWDKIVEKIVKLYRE